MKILVTGGGGFLGRAIVKRLLSQGHQVRVLQRSAHPDLAAQGVDVRQGSLAESETVEAAMEGVEVCFHVAAKAGVWGPWEDYYEANVTGTEHVVSAALKHQVKYLIHTSTPSVVCNGQSINGGNESLPYGQNIPSPYAQTKVLAEQAALLAGTAGTLKVCALRPHLIYGPGDPHLIPRVLEKARLGRLRIVGKGTNRVDVTHVENAAQAHLCALEALRQGRAHGEAFFISDGEPVALWPWLNSVLEAAGIPPLKRKIPGTLAWALGGLCETLWPLLKRQDEPPMTRFVASQLAHDHWFDISAARTELQYQPEISGKEGLQQLKDSVST